MIGIPDSPLLCFNTSPPLVLFAAVFTILANKVTLGSASHSADQQRKFFADVAVAVSSHAVRVDSAFRSESKCGGCDRPFLGHLATPVVHTSATKGDPRVTMHCMQKQVQRRVTLFKIGFPTTLFAIASPLLLNWCKQLDSELASLHTGLCQELWPSGDVDNEGPIQVVLQVNDRADFEIYQVA